jgi:hypothetical protein
MASWASMAAKAADAPEPVQANAARRAQTQAATAASSSSRFQPTGEGEAAFMASVERVLARWSLLRLAADMGWGDGDAAMNVTQFRDEILAWFQKKRAAVEASDLEDVLAEFINDRFHVIAEDGSPKEVSLLLVAIFKQCVAGDLTLAQQVMAQPLPDQAISAQCQAAPEPEEIDGDMSDSDDDELDDVAGGAGGGGFGGISSSSSSSASATASGGIADSMEEEAAAPQLLPAGAGAAAAAAAAVPDGWETVTRSGRRYR